MLYKLNQELHKKTDGSYHSKIYVLDEANSRVGIVKNEITTRYNTSDKLSTTEITVLVKGIVNEIITEVNKEGNYLIVTSFLEDNSGNILDKVSNNSTDAIADPD